MLVRLLHECAPASLAIFACLAGLALAVPGRAAARPAETTGTQKALGMKRRVTKTVECQYLLFLPKDYGKRRGERWPLILFLHGAGERGSDLALVRRHGPPKIVDDNTTFPFIVVSPQCPEDDMWRTDTLIGLLDEIQGRYAVDPDRVYVTGLSMGGYGTWMLAEEHPERFAAAVPICGGGGHLRARRLKDLPVWAFHGAKDKVVPVANSKKMVDAVTTSGGNAKLTIYPDAEHDSWTRTYANPELYAWLLAHRRGAPPADNAAAATKRKPRKP